MPNSTNSASTDSFLLGKIEATVTGTAEDVKAIRIDLGDLTKRLGGVETRVEAIEAEREVLVPQYTRWKHDISNQVQILVAWKHEQDGAFKGGNYVGKLLVGALGFFGGGAAILGAQTLVHPAKPVAKTEVTVERSIPVVPATRP